MLTSINPTKREAVTVTFSPENHEKARNWVEERQGVENIYFTVNEVMRSATKKPKKTDMGGIVCLHVDVDPRAGEDAAAERVRGLKVLQEHVPPPSVIVFSGGGYQGFWLLTDTQLINGDVKKAEELEAYNLQIELQLQGDHCHNVDRIMRLPGTINVPDERKAKKGRKPTLSEVVEAHWERRYDLKQFTPAARLQTPETSGAQVKLSGNLPQLGSVDDLPESVTLRMKAVIVQGDDPEDPTAYSSRSEATFAVCCALVRAGCDDDTIASILLDPDFGISAHCLSQPRAHDYAARQIQRAKENAEDPWLQTLNEAHAVIEDIGGKCRVISEVTDHALGRTRLSRQSFEDFRNRYMNQYVVVGKNKDGEPIYKPVGAWWLQHRKRRQYKTIVFAPGQVVDESYNLWRGFACESLDGDCGLFLTHIRDNVCGGDESYYHYLIRWLARMIQSPDNPGETAIIMRGRMGVGKSFFVKWVGALLGRHFLHISDPKHLVGSFNAHLRDCVLLFADEAFYAGDKKHESILKTMVTEETLMIEGKGIDADPSPNYTHLMMASNSDWVVPAGLDDRRFFVLDVADGQMQKGQYFGAIAKQLESGGLEAFLYHLMTMDLKGWNVRNVPKTKALQDQKLLSMSAEEQWWYEKLVDGAVTMDAAFWRTDMKKSDLQDDYIDYMDRQKIMRRMSPTALGKFLNRVTPDGWPQTTQKTVQRVVEGKSGYADKKVVKERPYFYVLPPLEICRDFWDTSFGGPYNWLKESDDDQPPLSTDPPF